MAKEVVLKAEPREGSGKEFVKRLRAQGLLPGVIYGAGIEARPLAISRHDLIRTLHAHGAHPLVTLKLDGTDYLALVKDVQIDAVHQEALHVDFHRVEADKPVHTQTAIHIVGDAAGVKMGGILEVLAHSIAIEALPRAIPEFIDFDVSEMNIGDVARIGDLTAPAGVTILTDADDTLVTVAAPRVEEVAVPTAEEVEAAEAEAAAEGEAPGAEAEAKAEAKAREPEEG